MMRFRFLTGALSSSVVAALSVLLLPGPAPAQGRGMAMRMPMSGPMMTMPGGMSMMRPSMPMSNAQAILLVTALRQRELFLVTAERQVEARILRLEMSPASANRDALLVAAQRQQTALTVAMRDVALQIAALQR